MTNAPRALAEVEQQIAHHQAEIAKLCAVGARLTADMRMSGAEVLAWLTGLGATDKDARDLCAGIVRERKAARAAAAESIPTN